MKKIYLFCIAVLLFSCNTDYKGSAPVLKRVVIATTQAMIDANTDAIEFTTSDYIRFHYTVADKDGDFDRGVVCIIDGNGEVIKRNQYPYQAIISSNPLYSTSGPAVIEFEETIIHLPGSFTVGSWGISVYYVDKAGNKSKTITKYFIVKE